MDLLFFKTFLFLVLYFDCRFQRSWTVRAIVPFGVHRRGHWSTVRCMCSTSTSASPAKWASVHVQYMYMQCKFFRTFKIRGFAYLLKKILKYCTRCSVNMQKLNPDNSWFLSKFVKFSVLNKILNCTCSVDVHVHVTYGRVIL